MHPFTATLSTRGTAVRWRTAAAIDLVGFNLYRERDGRLSRLNAKLIVARTGTRQWLDRNGRAGDSYRLHGVGLDGRRIWLGRVTVRAR